VFYTIILIVQQNYFSNLYPAKILESFNRIIFFSYETIRAECQNYGITTARTCQSPCTCSERRLCMCTNTYIYMLH